MPYNRQASPRPTVPCRFEGTNHPVGVDKAKFDSDPEAYTLWQEEQEDQSEKDLPKNVSDILFENLADKRKKGKR